MNRDAFVKSLVARTAALREGKGLSQQMMAECMGVTRDIWAKYETRSPLPHHLIPRYCAIVECDIEYFFTGRAHTNGRSPQSAPTLVTEFKPRKTG